MLSLIVKNCSLNLACINVFTLHLDATNILYEILNLLTFYQAIVWSPIFSFFISNFALNNLITVENVEKRQLLCEFLRSVLNLICLEI